MLGRSVSGICLYPMVFICVVLLCCFLVFKFVLCELNLSPQTTLWFLFWNWDWLWYEIIMNFTLVFFIEMLLMPHCIITGDLWNIFFYHLLWNNSDRWLTFCFLIYKILLVEWSPALLELMFRVKSLSVEIWSTMRFTWWGAGTGL